MYRNVAMWEFPCDVICRLFTELIAAFRTRGLFNLISSTLSLSFHLEMHNKGEAPFPPAKVLTKGKENKTLRKD
jgi:hypothetical protein